MHAVMRAGEQAMPSALEAQLRAWRRNSLLLGALGLLAAPLSISSASANLVCPGVDINNEACGASTSSISSDAVSSSVESAIEKRRKKKRKKYVTAPLGYAPSAIVTKAPEPATTTVDAVPWIEGSFTHENQSGTFMGSNPFAASQSARTNTWSALAGIEWNWDLPSDNSLSFSVFGGQDFITTRAPLGDQVRTLAPTVGAYAIYYAGDSFSAELNYQHSWMNSSGDCVTSGLVTECSQNTATALDEIEGNMYYKFNPDYADTHTWYTEPFVGFVNDYMTESLGIADQQTLRLQAGVRWGTIYQWGTVKVEPKLTAMVFSDVSNTGGQIPGCGCVAFDTGQLWGKGIAKVKFDWSNNFSSAIQGEVYGTSGTLHIIDYALLVELRYSFGGHEAEGE